MALAAGTVSIAVREIVDNAVMLGVPGAMDAGLAHPLFWGALVVAFVVTLPVNKWMIDRTFERSGVRSAAESRPDTV